jgi:hypothetical protein
MKLTNAHKLAMAAVKNGADVFSYQAALLLREVERNNPELITIVPAKSDIPGEQQQPYFGARLTAAGCRAIAEAA